MKFRSISENKNNPTINNKTSNLNNNKNNKNNNNN
jgi:hypothetical protein